MTPQSAMNVRWVFSLLAKEFIDHGSTALEVGGNYCLTMKHVGYI